MFSAPQRRSVSWVGVFGLLSGSLLAAASVVADEDPPTWMARWGPRGSEAGQFERPRSLTLDGKNRLLVCDSDNNRIQIFDTAGNLLDTWGETGSGPSQFLRPTGIDVAPNDEVYVVDADNNRVQRFQSDGTWLGEWDGTGHADSIWTPFAVTVDRHHNVYVTDGGRNISKFNSEGVFERSWNLGAQQHMWDVPIGIAASPNDYIYVTRTFTANVYQFELDGTLVRTWGEFSRTPAIPGTFKTPLGVDVDSLGNVFVVDHHNWRIQKFTGSGEFLSLWGIRGDQPEQFNDLHDITVGAGNNVFIVQIDIRGAITHWSYNTTAVEQTTMSRFKSMMRGSPGR